MGRVAKLPNPKFGSKFMPRVTIDITDREKIFIDPNSGNRITKLRGGAVIPGSSPHQETSNTGGSGSAGQAATQGETEAPKDVQITPEEIAALKAILKKFDV